FDFSSSQGYQILSFQELVSTDHETQALQFLTESRIVRGDSNLTDLRRQIAGKYGYVDNEHALDMTILREGLLKLKTAYNKGIIGRLVSKKQSLLNRKILKLFA